MMTDRRPLPPHSHDIPVPPASGKRLDGRVAVVLGAGSAPGQIGNGSAVAIRFAQEGAAVHLIDRDPAALETVTRLIGSMGETHSSAIADAADEAQIAAAMAEAIARHGRIDVLHNNVGVARPGGVLAVDMDDWRRAFDVNLGSALLAARLAVPHMPAGSSIINVSSISGSRVIAGLDYVSYPASKAALNHLSRVMAVEFGPRGIRCNVVVPGFMLTPMVANSVLAATAGEGEPLTLEGYLALRAPRIPLGHWGAAWDVANAALFLASDESRYVTGIELVVDGGATLMTG